MLYLLVLVFCGKCLPSRLDTLNYDFDDDTRNISERNEDINNPLYSRISGRHRIGRTGSMHERQGLQANRHVKPREKRSCELPEAAFLFKQVMIPENDVNTLTTVCKEPDVMSLLKFQGQKEPFDRPSEHSKSDESIDDDEVVLKAAIGFEIPENSKFHGKGHSFEEGNGAGIEHKAKSRLAQDIRSNRANMAFKEVLARIQTVEKLKGRSRREIRRMKFRARHKPRRNALKTKSHGKDPTSNQTEESEQKSSQDEENGSKNASIDKESRSKNLHKDKASSHRSWKEKLWENLRRSSSTGPMNTSNPSSTNHWKLFHIKSRSATTNAIPSDGVKYHFRRFSSKNHSAVSKPRAMHSGHQPRACVARCPGRPHKGHCCHYHYKNHRIREQQAFHRLKSLTKKFSCTPHVPDEEPSTGQCLDEDAIMSTFAMDLSVPTQSRQMAAATSPRTTMLTYPFRTHFRRVQTGMAQATIASKASSTTPSSQMLGTTTTPPASETTDTAVIEPSTTTLLLTHQIGTTAFKLTTHLTTINIDYVTGEGKTTETTVKNEDIKDDESSTVEVQSEPETTASHVHINRNQLTSNRKLFRKMQS